MPVRGALPTGAAVVAHGDAIATREIESLRNVDSSLELAASLTGPHAVAAVEPEAPEAEDECCWQAPDERCAEQAILPFWLRLVTIAFQQIL